MIPMMSGCLAQSDPAIHSMGDEADPLAERIEQIEQIEPIEHSHSTLMSARRAMSLNVVSSCSVRARKPASSR